MAKLPNITITRGDWGTPSYIELSVSCRVLKDGVFRGTFPENHAQKMMQFYKTESSELASETLAGLTKQLISYAEWLAESTEVSLIALFYQTKFNGEFSLSSNKLIGPEFTTRDEWQENSMSFETNALVGVGATLKRLTISTGRDGLKTYTLSGVGGDRLGEFGKKLIAYRAGPEIRGRHMTPERMPDFIEYTEALAEMFVNEIEATYYRAIDLRDKLQHLNPINKTI